MTIEGQDARQGLDRFLRRRDNAAGHSFVDDFRHGAASKCQDRRAASHGFYQRKPERFWPVDRKQQCERVAEKRRLSPLVDFANELYIRPGQKRHDGFAEIGLVDLVDLGGDFQGKAAGAGDRDGVIDALFRADAPEERQVVPARIEIRVMQVGGNPVVHGRHISRGRRRFPLCVGDRDERHLREAAIERLEVRKVLPAVQRGEGAMSDRSKDRKMELVDVEMKEVELVGPLAHLVEHQEIIGDDIPHRRREPKRRACDRLRVLPR